MTRRTLLDLPFLGRRGAPASPPPPPPPPPPEPEPPPPWEVMLGKTGRTPQYGIIGKNNGQRVALDLNGCDVISLFGVQGAGKSYTLGVIAEMAVREAPRISKLGVPLGVVYFHYHRSDAYEPEHASSIYPNGKQTEAEVLLRGYGATPAGLSDVVMLTPAAKLELRQREYPHIQVLPLKFGPSEIGSDGWRFLLGAVGNESLYVRQVVAIMRRLRDDLTPEKLREEVKAAHLKEEIEKLVYDRIALAEPYIDDNVCLGDLLRPGRTIIVDLRDEWIEKNEALGLLVVLLRVFGQTKHNGQELNKLFILDEVHKYLSDSALIGEVLETISQVRHQATTIVLASQNPVCLPRTVLELTSILAVHRMTSPGWLKHLQGAIASLKTVKIEQLAALAPGEALVWARTASIVSFTQRPQLVTIRPRFSQHGGATKTAVR